MFYGSHVAWGGLHCARRGISGRAPWVQLSRSHPFLTLWSPSRPLTPTTAMYYVDPYTLCGRSDSTSTIVDCIALPVYDCLGITHFLHQPIEQANNDCFKTCTTRFRLWTIDPLQHLYLSLTVVELVNGRGCNDSNATQGLVALNNPSPTDTSMPLSHTTQRRGNT